VQAVVSIGSNLGDREAAIRFAVDRIATFLDHLTLSPIVETEPEGPGLESQPLYLNAVLTGETTLGARDLLERLLDIEQAFGRERPAPMAPRTLDLDLILLGDAIVDEPGVQVPHPRFRERFFVLGPLVEIAPNLRDPVSGLRIRELLRALLRDDRR
jgi:2-amino-4-hydroxy-6-hydroxymethyldihydropteridine diphosphokinase